MTVLKILELVGVYILSHLETINKNGIGVYHNDRLVILEGANGWKMGKTRKNTEKIFKNIGFQIDISTSLKEFNFWDVIF